MTLLFNTLFETLFVFKHNVIVWQKYLLTLLEQDFQINLRNKILFPIAADSSTIAIVQFRITDPFLDRQFDLTRLDKSS